MLTNDVVSFEQLGPVLLGRDNVSRFFANPLYDKDFKYIKVKKVKV